MSRLEDSRAGPLIMVVVIVAIAVAAAAAAGCCVLGARVAVPNQHRQCQYQ